MLLRVWRRPPRLRHDRSEHERLREPHDERQQLRQLRESVRHRERHAVVRWHQVQLCVCIGQARLQRGDGAEHRRLRDARDQRAQLRRVRKQVQPQQRFGRDLRRYEVRIYLRERVRRLQRADRPEHRRLRDAAQLGDELLGVRPRVQHHDRHADLQWRSLQLHVLGRASRLQRDHRDEPRWVRELEDQRLELRELRRSVQHVHRDADVRRDEVLV